MTERVKAARFPYVAALLCAACVGAAVWTWMRYSYAWEVTADKLGGSLRSAAARRTLEDRYVRVLCDRRNKFVPARGLTDLSALARRSGRTAHWRAAPPPSGELDLRVQYHTLGAKPQGESLGEHKVIAGRVLVGDLGLVAIDTTASRFHGASIAGLAVGAMGVFVFSVALRHWLGERRQGHG